MENLIQIGLFVLAGFLLRSFKIFPTKASHVLNQIALYVSLPALILLKVPHIALTRTTLFVAIVPWLMLLLSAGLVLLAARIWTWSDAITGVLLLVVPLGNTGFLGVPVIKAFFGEAGLPILIVYDQVGTLIILVTYGSLVLARYGRGQALDLCAMLRRIFLFPPMIALLVGLALMKWSYPPGMVSVLEGVATTLTPLVMTAIGYQLTLRLPMSILKPFGTGLAIKLLIAPLTLLLICRLFGWNGLAYDVTIMEAGMPPMITASALAVAAGMNTELAVALAGLGMLCAFVTLPLLYGLVLL